MIKNILIIGSAQSSKDPEIYYAKYYELFAGAAKQSGIDIEIKTTLIENLIISVGVREFKIFDAKNQIDLRRYDFIFLRGSGFRQMFDVLLSISIYSQKHGIRLVNDYSHTYDFSKLAQAVHLTAEAIAVPQTVYVTPAIHMNNYSLPFGFPCILKDVQGAHGKNNYLVESFGQIDAIVRSKPAIRFILQEFIPNNGDLRILVLGNSQLIIKRNAVEGSHLNNTSQGGEAALIDELQLETAVLHMARLAAKKLNMQCAGVDIIIDSETKRNYVLEVNSQPQLHTGAFLDEKKRLVSEYLRNN